MVPASFLMLALMLSGGASSQEVDEAEVRAWVEQLASPRRSERQDAQLRLIRLPPSAAQLLAQLASPEGYEARRQLEYVKDHLAAHPGPVSIAGGEYRVGSDLQDDRNPARTVTIESFQLDATEVTSLDYYGFLRATNRRPPLHWMLNGGRYGFGEEHYPVRNVSFQDAVDYARWVGGRLPSADEWEVAAHLGSGAPYPWGEQSKPRLINASGRPVPVQSEPSDRSPSGCHDLAASVAEWVRLPGGRPAYRGGHYLSHSEYFRTVRAPFPVPDGSARGAVGFRVADRRPR